MAVITAGRLCRRNGMADIFAGIDNAAIEYLSSLTGSVSTSSSVPNLTEVPSPMEVSDDDPSLNTTAQNAASSRHNLQTDDDHDDDSNDYR